MRRLTRPPAYLVVAQLLAACGTPSAWVAATAPAPQAPGKQQPWQAPAPGQDDFDWLKLTSGEWLKGELVSERADEIVFDSDKLDKQTFDLEDVAEFRSPRLNTVVLEDKVVVRGTVRFRDGEIVVRDADGEHRFPMTRLLSIVPGDAVSATRWDGKVSLGITAQRGNTSQSTANARVDLTGRSAFSRYTFGYVGNLGEVDGAQNVNNHRVNGEWDLFVSRKWFLTPIGVSAYSDRFQNIDYQVIPVAGFGYHLIDRPSTEWDLNLGGGWRYTRYDSVQPGESIDESTAAIVPGTNISWDITDDVEYTLSYTIGIGVPNSASTNHHLLTGISIDLIGDLDLDVSFQWDRIGQPRTNADGTVPKKDDFRTTIGFGWEF